MEKKRNRNALRSQRLIQNALLSLMQENDIDQITISDIVNRADINRGTFYAHYKNIPDVLEQIADDYIDRFDKYLKEQRIRWTTSNAITIMGRFVKSLDPELRKTIRLLSVKKTHSAITDRMQQYFLDRLFSCMELPEDPQQREAFWIRMTFFGGGVTCLLQEVLSGKLPVAVSSAEKHLQDIVSAFEPTMQA